MKQIVLAITGASGAVYARSLAERLLEGGNRVHLVVSPHGRRLLREELALHDPRELVGGAGEALVEHPYEDLGDALASGSVLTDAMVICPASMNSVAAVAAGLADNLIARAAQVHLKQRRPLVLVPREMPLSVLDLENLLRLSRAGAIIAPACPGFYLRPAGVGDLVDFVVARVLDLMGVTHGMPVRYREL